MQTKGFLASLFDYSFHSMITTRIVKLVYVLTTIVIAIFYVAMVVLAFSASTVFGAVTLLVFGPLIALIELIWARILLEFVIAQFRIMDNTGRLAGPAFGGGAGQAPADEPPASPPGDIG